jgi:hypothetical protein
MPRSHAEIVGRPRSAASAPTTATPRSPCVHPDAAAVEPGPVVGGWLRRPGLDDARRVPLALPRASMGLRLEAGDAGLELPHDILDAHVRTTRKLITRTGGFLAHALPQKVSGGSVPSSLMESQSRR